MHRAGVDRAFRHRLGRAPVLVEIFCGISGEFGAAAGGAEIVGMPLVGMPVLRRVRVDRHAANGIGDAAFRRAVRMPMLMRVVVMMVVRVSHFLILNPIP
jgi:hypothetical protein